MDSNKLPQDLERYGLSIVTSILAIYATGTRRDYFLIIYAIGTRRKNKFNRWHFISYLCYWH